jgi:hypothetical protein
MHTCSPKWVVQKFFASSCVSIRRAENAVEVAEAEEWVVIASDRIGVRVFSCREKSEGGDVKESITETLS